MEFVLAIAGALLLLAFFHGLGSKLVECTRKAKDIGQREQTLVQRTKEVEQREAELTDIAIYLEEQNGNLDRKAQVIANQQAQLNDQVRARVIALCENISHRQYLQRALTLFSFSPIGGTDRALSALTSELKILPPFNISAQVQGSHGAVYEVDLSHCTCTDFQIHRRPCKHMYRLALEIGLVISRSEELTQLCGDELRTLQSQIAEAKNQLAALNGQKDQAKKRVQELRRIAEETSQQFPYLAHLYAEYYDGALLRLERELYEKHPPAKESAKRVAELRREIKPLNMQVKMLQHQILFYETLFPWLEDFKEIPPQEAFTMQELGEGAPEGHEEYEVLRTWLSPQEYQSLPRVEKYQLALDRFQRREKSNWQIGIEYERYIGYLCEQQGYRVEYSGAVMGLNDMGRDLILSAPGTTVVIQCKRWAKEKVLHEKHIFQLFGSSVLLSLKDPTAKVIGVFVTTTCLSDVARRCASRLGVRVYEEVPMGVYPLIKCNISHNGEKIYHLPFDQQYDHVVVDPARGELYAFTVAEAENAGFRRAFRWHSQPQ